MSDDEQVICVPAALVAEGLDQGLNRVTLLALLNATGYTFLRRADAERDPNYKHLATYAVLTCRHRVFTYRRGKSGGESRLHDRKSLGVGGTSSATTSAMTSRIHRTPSGPFSGP